MISNRFSPLRPSLLFASLVLLAGFCTSSSADDTKPEKQWVTWEGKDGPGKGKHIVFVAGANEYNPESGLPILAHILAERQGFNCTVLFTINKKTGEIDPNTNDNLPGLEALDHADLMVILCRFRELPDDQMKHIVDYLESGKPVVGLRTATHSFQYNAKSTSIYKKYTHNNKDAAFEGGFGRQVLGETWIRHHGPNGATSTRGIFAPGASSDPILRGIGDGEIWGTTGVYGVRLPLLPNCKTLLLGQVIEGNKPDGKPAEFIPTGKPRPGAKPAPPVKANDPMQPIAWTRTYSIVEGKTGRVFTTTMGSAGDMQNEAFRRLMVNACFWAIGLEDKIPAKADVNFVGPSMPFKKGMKPEDIQ
jgi:type 1 glutamine amidotransferase